VPTYNTEIEYLTKMIESVMAQSYENWELCIADGGSTNAGEIEKVLRAYAKIKYTMLKKNRGISKNTNAALKLATGEYIALLDHDDELSHDALLQVVLNLQEVRYDFIYSDSNMIDAHNTQYSNIFYKPQYSPDIMYSANYLTHLSVIRTDLFKQVGNFNRTTDGAQDWDMFLRVCEKTNKILHIPKILYHWRMIPTSVTTGPGVKPYAFENQVAVINRHLKRMSKKGKAEFYDRVNWRIRIAWDIPRDMFASIIIYNQNEKNTVVLIEQLQVFLAGIRYEIIVVSKNNFYLLHKDVLFIYKREAKDYSSAYNIGAKAAKGNIYFFIDSTYQFKNAQYINDILLWAGQPEIGAVFPELLSANDTINSIGLIINENEIYDMYAGKPLEYYGLMGGSEWKRNFKACREYCFAVKSSLFKECGGLEESYKEYAIVDFCLYLYHRLGRNVYIPYVKLWSDHILPHYESGTDLYQGLIYKYKIFELDPYSNINYESKRDMRVLAL